MGKVWKTCLLLFILALVFFTSGWMANYLLSVTGCVYTSGGAFSISFMGMCAGLFYFVPQLWDMFNIF